jgi:histidine ammonia-lyase
MGWGAGKKLLEVVANVRRVLAIELLCAAQGVEYRAPLAPGEGTGRLLAAIRRRVPPLTFDRSPSDEIETLAAMIETGQLASII